MKNKYDSKIVKILIQCEKSSLSYSTFNGYGVLFGYQFK